MTIHALQRPMEGPDGDVARKPDSRSAATGRTETGADEPAASRMLERQRRLRSMLVDARDALIRSKLGLDERAEEAWQGAGNETDRNADDQPGYHRLRRLVRRTVTSLVPSGARVAVVSRGDPRLLEIGDERTAWHFPRHPDGRYAGYHPPDSRAAIDHLEELRELGAEYLVLPATSIWWLEHYVGLRRHLESRYRSLVHDVRTCAVYDLRETAVDAAGPGPAVSAAEPESAVGTAEPDSVVSAAVSDARGAAEPETADDVRPSGNGADRPLAAVTIISRNYLAQARVLARSFLEHEPRGRFYLLVVDGLPDDVDVGADVELVDPERLEIPDLWEMCFKYGIVEFNTAVKPYLLSLLLRQYGEEEVVYFDPDIIIMRPLTELREALNTGPIVLTPHIMSPVPLDGLRPSEQDIMVSGAYNLGFIALRHCEETEAFLEWWEERLQDGCRIDVERGLFTDQKWIDLVPSLFPSTMILRDPTYNVAFWNLHERSVSRDGDGFLVNDRPAAFFHISGFDPEEPDRLSKHQNRIEVVEDSGLADLLEIYARRLLDSGHREARQWEYGYDRFENDIRVHPLLRQLYLKLPPDERRRFGNPFSTSGPDSFLDWATRPRPEDGRLSRFLEAVYQVRYDLPLSFPDVRGADRRAFLKWARRWGSREMGFEPEIVRDEILADASANDPAGAGSGKGDGSGKREGGTVAAEGVPGSQARDDRIPARRIGAGKVSATASNGGGYRAVVQRIRDLSRAALPAGSRVLVVSKGDYRLVDLGGSEGWHFPQTDDGTYGGFHPPDSQVAIAHLEALRQKGADYLLIPQTALWWLEYYEGFRRHLEGRYRPVVKNHDACVIYSLGPGGDNGAGPTEPPFWRRWLERASRSLFKGGAP